MPALALADTQRKWTWKASNVLSRSSHTSCSLSSWFSTWWSLLLFCSSPHQALWVEYHFDSKEPLYRNCIRMCLLTSPPISVVLLNFNSYTEVHINTATGIAVGNYEGLLPIVMQAILSGIFAAVKLSTTNRRSQSSPSSVLTSDLHWRLSKRMSLQILSSTQWPSLETGSSGAVIWTPIHTLVHLKSSTHLVWDSSRY